MKVSGTGVFAWKAGIIYRLLTTSLLLVLWGSGLLGSEDRLKKHMGTEIYEQAGLSKLTEAEREVLVDWLEGNGVRGSENTEQTAREMPQGEDAFGLESLTKRVAQLFQSEGPERIKSRVKGTFNGWDGDTTFRLTNGQVWQQMDDDRFYVHKEEPTVVIRRAALGSYLLSVEGYGSSVRVRRLK